MGLFLDFCRMKLKANQGFLRKISVYWQLMSAKTAFVTRNLSKASIVLIALIIVDVNFNNHLWLRNRKVVADDVISYYSYLPAAFIYHDLSFRFQDKDPDFFKDKMYNSKTADGGTYQKMTMGLAFLYLPFFLLGHLSAWLLGYETHGYTAPYFFFLVFSALFYLVVGLIYLRKILQKYADDSLVAITLLLVVFATNLLYYSTLEATMPHVYNFALFTVFVWQTMRWYAEPTGKHAVFTGLIYGLIVLVRPANALISLFFIFYGIRSFSDAGPRISFFLKRWRALALLLLAAFMVVLPQLIFWKVNTGHWLFYSYNNEGFFFANPQILDGLFSYRKGWFVYTPLMALAVIGLWPLWKTHRGLALPMIIFLIFNVYLIFSWWSWWYGGSFGARPLVDSYGLMAIPLAVLLGRAFRRSKVVFILLMVLSLLLVKLNVFQTYQYKNGSLHYDSMSKAAYWHMFGRMSADLTYYDLLDPLDYTLAIEGIYRSVPVLKVGIREQAETGFEALNEAGDRFISPGKHYHFSGADLLSEEKYHSGKRAVKLTPSDPYGAGIDFSAEKGDRYLVTVWKYPANAKASVVFTAYAEKGYSAVQHDVVETDATGWGKLSMIAEIPAVYTDGRFKAFVWNRSSDTVYFDDFSIEYLGKSTVKE